MIALLCGLSTHCHCARPPVQGVTGAKRRALLDCAVRALRRVPHRVRPPAVPHRVGHTPDVQRVRASSCMTPSVHVLHAMRRHMRRYATVEQSTGFVETSVDYVEGTMRSKPAEDDWEAEWHRQSQQPYFVRCPPASYHARLSLNTGTGVFVTFDFHIFQILV